MKKLYREMLQEIGFVQCYDERLMENVQKDIWIKFNEKYYKISGICWYFTAFSHVLAELLDKSGNKELIFNNVRGYKVVINAQGFEFFIDRACLSADDVPVMVYKESIAEGLEMLERQILRDEEYEDIADIPFHAEVKQ